MEMFWEVVKAVVVWKVVWVPHWLIDAWSFGKTRFAEEGESQAVIDHVSWLTAMNQWTGAFAGLGVGYASHWLDFSPKWLLLGLAYSVFLLARGAYRGPGMFERIRPDTTQTRTDD